MKFDDKVAIVTGAASGLGKAMAARLASEGATVTLVDLNEAALDATVSELAGNGWSVSGHATNLAEVANLDTMVNETVQQHGQLDVLVNNAGIQIRKWATEFPEDEFDLLMDINLKAVYFASRAAARHMKERGSGSIVCISSGNASRFTSKRTPYCISKAAINGLAAALGNEWGRFGIRVNAVAPGYVFTEMVRKGIAEGIIDPEAILPVVPMKRFLEPEEIANAVAFLASDEASGITGQTLYVDGGWSVNGLPEPKDLI